MPLFATRLDAGKALAGLAGFYRRNANPNLTFATRLLLNSPFYSLDAKAFNEVSECNEPSLSSELGIVDGPDGVLRDSIKAR